jgi:hypothetical protein
MISDMVLLEKLPEALKKNVMAYVGCISGAELKTAYLKKMEKAGFRNTKVIEETKMPMDQILSDATAKAIVKQLKLTRKRVVEILGSVVSIKVSAKKP